MIAGTWELRAFRTTYGDGRPPEEPWGPEPTGRIVYTPDGYVSAVLARGGRSGGTDLETSDRASDEEKAVWFDSYLSYSGRWRVEGEQVVHAIDLALVPAMVGREVRRSFALQGDTLDLSYSRTSRSGTVRTFTLTWERA